MRFRRLAWVLPLALGLLAGCGEERPPVSYVQPDYVEKAFFVGDDLQDPSDDPEFYYQASLIDVGYGAAQEGLFTSSWAQILNRIKWVIQEDMLLARLSYQRIDNSDGKGAGPSSTDGIIVAAFRITSHFDIQRRYNPTTGEKMNIIEENTVDRPWYGRRYMRVDWSKNENTDNYDFDMLALLDGGVGVKYNSMSYYVNDPSSEDAPHFDVEAGYLDVTTKAMALPQDITISEWGATVPACFFPSSIIVGGTNPSGQCNPVELTIRLAFRKVVDNDYEPQDWDSQRFSAYGAFFTERLGYARNYGMTDVQWHRFINRHNIWHRSHYYGQPESMTGPVECYVDTPAGQKPNRDDDGNGTADECETVTGLTGFAGSQCDIFKQKCTLPYRTRKAVTIPWYYTTGSNQEYFDGSEWATHEWDVALRSAVMVARYAECVSTGDEFPAADGVVGRKGDPTRCREKYPAIFGQMDEDSDAVALARDVDACRRANGYDSNQEANCAALADGIGGVRKNKPGVIWLAKQPEMVVLCHSPVENGDHPSCGGPRLPADLTAAACDRARDEREKGVLEICRQALNARPGDIRYHLINVIKMPQTPSPWGIMVDAHDPLTGEKISASVNVWSHVTDQWTQGVVDTARYIRGELTDGDVTEGKYIDDWASAAEHAASGSLSKMNRDTLDRYFAATLDSTPERIARFRESTAIDPAFDRAFVNGERTLRQARFEQGAESKNGPVYANRRKLATGTAFEAELITPAMQQFAGARGLPAALTTQLSSPLRMANPAFERDLRQRRDLALARRGACALEAEAPAPLSIANLARQLEAKFGAFDPKDAEAVQLERAERMRRYVAQKSHYSVLVHEMGHSMGLRHNFVSSADPLGYRPQYWQLRTKDGSQRTICSDFDPTGACVGPRYFDPVTDEERDNLIWMWMQSSTMDYAGEITQDLLGLGAYDFAAARMFYGENVAVFDDASYLDNTNRGRGMLDKMENWGGIIGIKYTIGANSVSGPTLQSIHYSELQKRYELISNCHAVDPDDFKPSNWNTDRDGEWSPLLDGLLVKVDGKHTRCDQQSVDYRGWETLNAGTGTWGDPIVRAIDAEGRVRVPYGFASDERADIGNLSVYRHDNGGDPYELFDFLITQQEVGHIFNNYRHGRRTFSIHGAATQTLHRFNEKIRDAAKGMTFLRNIYKDIAIQQRLDPDELWEYMSTRNIPDNLLASGIAFDHFSRQLQRPEHGPHYLPDFAANPGVNPPIYAEDGVWRSGLDSRGPTPEDDRYPLVIPNGATGRYGNVSWGGRPLENAYADDKGEYTTEYPMNAGSYYEKAYTAMLFTESVDMFVNESRGDFRDSRFRSVSLADLFPEGYRRWLANNLTGDDRLKGVWLQAKTQDGVSWPLTDEVTRFPTGSMGYTTWLPADGPKMCFTGTNAVGGSGPGLSCGASTGPMVVVDPEIGWEQQKFLIAWTLLYLPENQKQYWLNMLNIWELGADSDPGFMTNRIEFHDPSGKIYVARTFGKETLFAGTDFEQTVQKGVAARILEYANGLLAQGFEVDPVDYNGDGTDDWYRVRTNADGLPIIKFDPAMRSIYSGDPAKEGCNALDNSKCTCDRNRACTALQDYTEVPYFMRQAMAAYGLADPTMKGIYQ